MDPSFPGKQLHGLLEVLLKKAVFYFFTSYHSGNIKPIEESKI